MQLQGGFQICNLDSLLLPSLLSVPGQVVATQVNNSPHSANTGRSCFSGALWMSACRCTTEAIWNLEEKMFSLRRILLILWSSEECGERGGIFSTLKAVFYLIAWASHYIIHLWENLHSKISERKDMDSSPKTKTFLETSLWFLSCSLCVWWQFGTKVITEAAIPICISNTLRDGKNKFSWLIRNQKDYTYKELAKSTLQDNSTSLLRQLHWLQFTYKRS